MYLHAGGFTSGDKTGDRDTLAWLCGKGYVAAGINYTLRTDGNTASVLSQSNEIKAAVPKVVEAAEAAGYHIDKMTVAGGSAGHTLAMIYAYRDAVRLLFPWSSPSARSDRPAFIKMTGTTTALTRKQRKPTRDVPVSSVPCWAK